MLLSVHTVLQNRLCTFLPLSSCTVFDIIRLQLINKPISGNFPLPANSTLLLPHLLSALLNKIKNSNSTWNTSKKVRKVSRIQLHLSFSCSVRADSRRPWHLLFRSKHIELGDCWALLCGKKEDESKVKTYWFTSIFRNRSESLAASTGAEALWDENWKYIILPQLQGHICWKGNVCAADPSLLYENVSGSNDGLTTSPRPWLFCRFLRVGLFIG